MTQRGQWVFVLVILGLLGAALIAGLAVTPALAPVSVESKAPGFEAVDVVSRDTVRLDAYRGRVILLNVWATWCPPCVAEMPSIQRLYDQLGSQGLAVVAVSVDNTDTEDVEQWIRDRGFTFDVLHDRAAKIEQIYQTTGVPESFIIDREGVIVKKLIGPAEWDHPTQVTLLRRLLRTDGEILEDQGS
jgi:cytochrome c biogenesis protein CcmG/thiol:disulfide interchange protein DsbE